MIGGFELIDEIYENFLRNSAEIRSFIGNFKKIACTTDLNELKVEQLEKLVCLIDAVIGRMKSYPPPSNRPFTSLQADITFGLQWFLNECLQMNLPFFKTCRRILHLGLKPTGQGLSVSDEWLRIDLQMSSSAELVVLDAVDEETLCRLLKRDSSCLKQVLKNNPNSKRIISLFIDSFFDANLLSLLTGSAELDFIGDQLSRLSI